MFVIVLNFGCVLREILIMREEIYENYLRWKLVEGMYFWWRIVDSWF